VSVRVNSLTFSGFTVTQDKLLTIQQGFGDVRRQNEAMGLFPTVTVGRQCSIA
jgi:hypothetical protein